MHGVGVKQLDRNHLSRPGGGKPERAADLVTAHLLREKQLERTSQHRRGGLVALRYADRERVEYDVNCARRLRTRRGSTPGLRRSSHAAGAIEIARQDRRHERV